MARPRKKMFLAVFCGEKDGDGYLFWECTFHTLLHVRELPEFASLMSLDRSKWPRCLSWRGWLPWLLHLGTACGEGERCFGAYPVDFAGSRTPPEYWDAGDIALEMSEHPNIWTDGSREDFSSVGGFEVAGAGVYLPASELAFEGSVW